MLPARSEFVGQEQRPTAAEWPAQFLARRALRPPCAVERGQEIDRVAAIGGACDAVLPEHQRFAIAREQEVPATLRGACSRRFQQQWITLRRQPMQREQVGIRIQGARDQHAFDVIRDDGNDARSQTRRSTSVPLVPPKPNEFDIAISTCCSRAVCGT